MEKAGRKGTGPVKTMESETGILKLDPISTLGKGTFGRVILARATISAEGLAPSRKSTLGLLQQPALQDNSLVAVKIIPKSGSRVSKKIQKAETELKVLTEVAPDSPFLVPCRYALQTDDLLVYIMDYSIGGDLRTHLRRVGRLSESIVVVICMQVVLGLEHLHSYGILYRDLKPDNLLISSSGRIRLADFGLSKFLPKLRDRSRLAKFFLGSEQKCEYGTTRTACGTPMYQAPEMVMNKPHSVEADWWAFGNLIFELLTGKCPFYADSVSKVHQRILQNQIKYPSYLSYNAVQIISKLLTSKRVARLGYGRHGADDVKADAFFTEIQNEVTWERLERMRPSRGAHRRNERDDEESSNPSFFLSHRQDPFVRETVPPNLSLYSVDGFVSVRRDTFSSLITIASTELSHVSAATTMSGESSGTLGLQ